MSNNQLAKINKLKKVMNSDSVQEQFKNALDKNSGAFVASVIDLYNSDNYLQNCEPSQVVMEALKAATLKLPINKQLGFAYIVPYKKKKGKEVVYVPQCIIGYKGYIQLAMRTGQYRYLNSGYICEGIEVERDLLTGKVTFNGEKKNDKIIGYFAYMELLNGFTKTVYMTTKEVHAHGKRYSPSYSYSGSTWKTDFDSMAEKTTIRQLLSKYGYMSTEMVAAFSNDTDFSEDSGIQEEIDNEANDEVLDIEPDTPSQEEESETQEGPAF